MPEDERERSQGGNQLNLADLLSHIEEQNLLKTYLIATVEENTDQVQKLRQEIGTRPTRAESNRRRRLAIWFFVLYGFLLFWGHDIHLENCGPGARNAAAIDAVAHGDFNPQDLQKIASADHTNWACDLVVPWFTHQPNDPWPNKLNLYGIGAYTFLFIGLSIWTFTRRHEEASEMAVEGPRSRNRVLTTRDLI